MFATASKFAAASVGQTVTIPRRLARAPIQSSFLEGVWKRNALLDALFYDVRVVSSGEASAIAPWLAAEGAVLIVPPTGRGSLTLCPSIDDFFAAGGDAVRVIAVAGVGSSALGSAAFARNVANAVGDSVAAVVSGYGLADLAAEALGGFFWFGALNGLRHTFESLDDLVQPGRSETLAASDSTSSPIRQSLDTRSVMTLLGDSRFSFDLLVGHSKGNLVLSEALYDLRTEDADRVNSLAAGVKIVTVSAKVAMPQQFKTVIDIMGEWDWFGRFNSRGAIPTDLIVPGAWHHTNTELPAALGVTSALTKVL